MQYIELFIITAIDYVSYIKEYYDYLTLDLLEMSRFSQLLITPLIYLGVTGSIYLLRRVITCNKNTQYIKELSSREYYQPSHYKTFRNYVFRIINSIFLMLHFINLINVVSIVIQTSNNLGTSLLSVIGWIDVSLVDITQSGDSILGIDPFESYDYLVSIHILECMTSVIVLLFGKSLTYIHVYHYATIMIAYGIGLYSTIGVYMATAGSIVGLFIHSYYITRTFNCSNRVRNLFSLSATVLQILTNGIAVMFGFIHMLPQHEDSVHEFYTRHDDDDFIPGIKIDNYLVFNLITLSIIISYLLLHIKLFTMKITNRDKKRVT